VSFTATSDIPEGVVPESLNTEYGAIEVAFPTKEGLQNFWAVDLGTGKNTNDVIPCRYIKGIEPATGLTNITCKLVKAGSVAVGQSAKVRITGFKKILTSTAVEFHVMDVANPDANNAKGNVTVSLFRVLQR
jgi:hypothetical protein